MHDKSRSTGLLRCRFESCRLHQFKNKYDIGMSPSGKAPDFDSGTRRFESCHPSHDPLAQSVEQLPFKQWVRSSNLLRVTMSGFLQMFSSLRQFSVWLSKPKIHGRSSIGQSRRSIIVRCGFESRRPYQGTQPAFN